jgi:hypothetical protein
MGFGSSNLSLVVSSIETVDLFLVPLFSILLPVLVLVECLAEAAL